MRIRVVASATPTRLVEWRSWWRPRRVRFPVEASQVRVTSSPCTPGAPRLFAVFEGQHRLSHLHPTHSSGGRTHIVMLKTQSALRAHENHDFRFGRGRAISACSARWCAALAAGRKCADYCDVWHLFARDDGESFIGDFAAPPFSSIMIVGPRSRRGSSKDLLRGTLMGVEEHDWSMSVAADGAAFRGQSKPNGVLYCLVGCVRPGRRGMRRRRILVAWAGEALSRGV
jgi:hypothetical protein